MLKPSNSDFEKDALSGVSVYWYNLGKVMDPQPNMSDPDIRKISAIYDAVFKYLGAKQVKLDNYSAISNNATSVKSDFYVQPAYINELEIGTTIDINEKIGRFEPDKDTLINQSEVEDKITSFAKRFNANSDKKLKITGYIAICNGGDNGELGAARAQVIANILTSKFNIPANKIEVHGEGGPPPLENQETDICDNSNPEIMAQRRTVRIEVVKE